MKSEADTFDAIIIGTGQAGNPLANSLAGAGWKTAVVEKEFVGGSCINVGCTPTKTMVASARVAYLARRSSDYGVNSASIEIDMKKIRERKRAIVESFRGGSQKRLEGSENIDLIFGAARFVDSHTVAVELAEGGSRLLRAPKIFINTGTRPAIPDVPGINTVPFLTSAEIMELDEVPEHLIVLGGGYIGLEFGQMFRRFGSKVTIIQRGPQLLTREDADVAEEIAAILREDGVTVLLQSEGKRIQKKENGKFELSVESPDGTVSLSGSHLLVAAGRVPNSDDLNLPAAGIATDAHGFIVANERLETAAEGVYALGDVKGGPAFTHISYDDFRIIRQNLLESGNASINGRQVPYTVFIDPQLGRIGLSEKDAKAAGISYRLAKIPMTYVARALETAETRGFMKALVDRESDRILGAAILGLEGGEVMAVIQMAMLGGLPFTALRDGIFAHPTLAEALNTLFSYLED